MLWLIVYFLVSVVIARWLEKKMRIAAVFHSIMFTIITMYLLLVSNVSVISNMFKYFMGDSEYEIFRSALLDKYRINSYEISVFIILEFILLVLSVLVLAVSAVVIIKDSLEIVKRKLGFFKKQEAHTKYILVEWHYAEKIYLHFCRLLN
ncbi:MAG: hypothetical protein SOY54_01720 [Bacilli bacterium]|nr:hypothetical protein [Bacilli bacterium]CCY07224.1 unknown [Coprobacillus sp. CAG:698]